MCWRTLPVAWFCAGGLYPDFKVKVVIAGCGRVGSLLAQLLDKESHQVTVIDAVAASLRQLDASFAGTAVAGDATDEEVLKNAGVEEAQAFVAVTQMDNRNILMAQIAQHIFKVPQVICRINDIRLRDIYEDLGLETISPAGFLSQLMKDKIVG